MLAALSGSARAAVPLPAPALIAAAILPLLASPQVGPVAGFYAHPNGTGQGVIVSSGAYNPARRLDLPRFFYFNTWSVKIEGG